MMKMSLCFLVLAISSPSRGQNDSSVSPQDATEGPTAPPQPLDQTPDEASSPTMSSASPQNHSTATTTHLLSTNFTAQEETQSTEDLVQTTEGVNGSTAAQTAASVSRRREADVAVITTVAMAAATTSSKPETMEGGSSSSWGYVILVLIILAIIALCVILYLFRRASRSYSFNLHRPHSVNHLHEPTGTFEPVYLDDLDRGAPKDQVTSDDLSPPAAANGTTVQSEASGSNGESAPHEQPAADGPETSAPGDPRPPPGDETSSPLSVLLLDAVREERPNENNNNPSICSSDPFVEINLDDPAWCDDLLTSPGAPSSVLPFSPFSFSSSSSSS